MNQRKYIKEGSMPTKFGFRVTNQKCKQKSRDECVPVLPMSMTELNLDTSQTISVREFRDVPESFETNKETRSTDSIHQDVDSTFYMPVDAIDDVDLDAAIPIAHDVQLEEVTNNQDNVSAQPETPLRKKLRRCKPRFVGDCDPNDLKSPRKAMKNWKLAMSYIESQKRKINVIQQQNRRLRRRVTDLKSLLPELKDKNLISRNAQELLSISIPDCMKSLLESQFKKTLRSPYPEALKTFASTLHFYSTKAYNYVRRTFMKSLPHPDTIRRWHQNFEGSSGITEQAIDTLKAKIEIAAEQNKILYFSLSIDEMAIRRLVEWDGKEYSGFVDYGTGIDDDELPEAKNALVFLLTCINMHFKLPIAYYLIDGLAGEERANLLKQCLTILHNAKVLVVSVTVDGTSCNISMLNAMGALLNSVRLKPYFDHPVSGERIYILLDACHMLKLVRNALASLQVLYDEYGNLILWLYLAELVKLQEMEGLHAATKVRRRHLNWEKEKMKVSLAAQVLSRSVANALQFCEKDFQLELFTGCTATAEFLMQINDIFDLLNSRNLLCKTPTKRCITRENLGEVSNQVNEYSKYIKGLQDKTGPVLQSTRKTGFLGLLVCMQSAIGIAEKIFHSDENMKFLLTYKMSRDYLETFFAAIRSRGGCNNNPSARQFKAAYRRLLVHVNDVHISKGANCQPIDGTKILSVSQSLKSSDGEHGIDTVLRINSNSENATATPTSMMSDELYQDSWSVSEYAENVVAYIAGFIARSISKHLECDICWESLIRNQSLSHLQKRKDQGGLLSASEDVVELCMICEKTFRSFKNVFHMKNIIAKLMITTLARVPPRIFKNDKHVFEQTVLSDHRMQLLKLVLKKYFNLRLHHEGASRQDLILRLRNKYNKMILFKNL